MTLEQFPIIDGEENEERAEDILEAENNIREARETLQQKGFAVDQAGFDVLTEGFTMGGYFTLNDEAKDLLEDIGVSSEEDERGRSRIFCALEDYSYPEVAKKMLEIAEALPQQEEVDESGS